MSEGAAMIQMDDVVRRLIEGAYEMGWRDANRDHMAQEKDPTHPIGRSKRTEVTVVISALDPNNMLGLNVLSPSRMDLAL